MAHRETILALSEGRSLRLGNRPRLMGILNLTPDSFSDGGRWLRVDAALAHARRMIAEGAEILDLGAESTRPGGGVYGAGADEVPAGEEIDRLLPVLRRLRGETDLPLSVDTRKAEVAAAVLGAGADLINDVGGLSDPEMGPIVASAGCPIVLMHSRGTIRSMQREIAFEHVVEEVLDELRGLCDRAVDAGIARERILVDPGIGFGKNREQNFELIGALDRLATGTGRPVLLGASRKSFISRSAPPSERLGGSLAAVAAAAASGTAIVRVHDVGPTRQFLEVWDAIHSRRSGAPAGAPTGGAPAGRPAPDPTDHR